MAPKRAPRRAPALDPLASTVQRGVVLAAIVLVTLAMWTTTNDIYTVPKAMFLQMAGLAGLAGVVWFAGRTGLLVVPRGWAVRLLGAALVVMLVACLIGDLRMLSLVGEYGRSAGLLTYFAAAVLLFATATSFAGDGLERLTAVLAGVAGVAVAYGLLESVGVEPFHVPEVVSSTFGQVNYLGGFCGIAAPVFGWVALRQRHPLWLRSLGVAGIVGAVIVGVNTHSFQTYLSIGGGMAFLAVVEGLGRWGTRRTAAAAVIVIVLGAAVGLAAHNRIETEIRSGLDERVLMWQAGGKLVREHPVQGWGWSGYAANFSRARPEAHAVRFGTYQLVDVPHNVPLSWFVAGGLPLGLLYLGFVGATGLVLVRSLRGAVGDRRLLLAALGGAWFGYQLQSLVSIDSPSLVLWHFVTAGAILAAGAADGPRVVELRFLTTRTQGRRPATGGVVAGGVAVVLALIGAWFAIRPMRADLAFARARDLRASGLPEGAIADLRTTTNLVGWNGTYWAELAGALASSGDQDGALVAGEHAMAAAPSRTSYALSLAQLAERMGRMDVAERSYLVAVRNGPHVIDVELTYGDYLIRQGRFKSVIPYLEDAVSRHENFPNYWALLARAYAGAKADDKAKAAWLKVIELEPRNPEALKALGRT